MFCYYNKKFLSALELMLYELDAKKCQVSLVVKYIYIFWSSATVGFLLGLLSTVVVLFVAILSVLVLFVCA